MKYDIKSLTLDEKIELLVGRNSWNLSNANGKLPDMFLADGPCGLRKVENEETQFATAMPSISSLSYSWDTELIFLDGATIADDCVEKDVDVLLAPGVNIKRTPLCGRNFEYFSEDPFLAGVLAKAFIEGVQSKGIGTSLKHFCCNNIEYDRLYQSSELDERTLREIYLPAFEIALQAKPWTVMCSYNPVNGVWTSEHEYLLNDVLRKEFGFDGLIVSDWNAVHSSARAHKATLDLRMPYNENAVAEVKEGLQKGLITEEDIDACVTRILAFIEKAKTAEKKVEWTKEQRHENAVKIAKDCIVLLKNEENVLPVQNGNTVIVGSVAHYPVMVGGGSARVRTDYKFSTLADELQKRTKTAQFSFHNQTYVNSAYEALENAQSFYAQAYKADNVILCLANSTKIESEGWDRESIRLSAAQENFILKTAEMNKNVTVVLYTGSAVDMSAWIDKVKGVVLAGYNGEGVTEALADVLSGQYSPCGKITETYPLSLEDTPTGAYLGDSIVNRYTEGVFVGYRYYDTMKKEVLFPFGHGLSYAEFEYSDLQIKKQSETDYEVFYTVKNVSGVDGKEISQVYVRDVMSRVSRPVKELKGFAKTTLKAGESKRVSVKLNARAFAFYSTALKKWHIENGDFEILVGASSRDIRLVGKLKIELPETEQYTLPY